MSDLREAAMSSKAWPFEEARKLLKRYQKAAPEKGYVLFETGYGPSGLPHIGTFGEVARTTMIRRAFEEISDIPTRLICFSDDMDGMRKVPDNVPNTEMLHEHLQKPLTSVPDPFGEFDSFGGHNNAMLRRFLDTFGFEYEFYSATEFYKSGQFDEVLLRAVDCYDEIMAVMLKSLREERRQTYSIFLPIHPETGRVLYVPMKEVNAKDGTVTFDDEEGREWIDTLEDDSAQAAEQVEETHDIDTLRGWLVSAMDVLTARERFIVTERKLRDAPRTLESLGNELGLSKERVRQLEAAAFAKMRKRLEAISPEVHEFFA